MEGKMEIRTDAGGAGRGGLGKYRVSLLPSPSQKPSFPVLPLYPTHNRRPPPPPLEKQEEAPFGTGRLRGTNSSTSTAPEQGFR